MSVEFCAQPAPYDSANTLAPDSYLLVPLSSSVREAVKHLRERSVAKHNGYLRVRLDLPFRPRTTGPQSQSAHLHGHCQQLCEYTGHTMDEMKAIIKAATPSWPHSIVEYGPFLKSKRIEVWASEADVSMEVESEAIEMTHRIAADLGMMLREE